MAAVVGFAPWVVYWVLVGNAPFRVAVLAALAVAVVGTLAVRLRRTRPTAFDLGNLAVFVVLALAAVVLPDALLERWLQPLGNAGLLAVALVGLALGRPFVRDYAVGSVDAATARTDGFRWITTAMTWLWTAAFALMTAISAIPPLVDGAATLRDAGDTLSVVCYWVLPFVLLGLAGAVSAAFPPWFDHATARLDARSGPDPAPVPQPAAEAPEAAGLVVDAPDATCHDEPFALRVRGVPTGTRVRVTTTGADLTGHAWRAEGVFVPDDAGCVDVAATAPESGDWDVADADAPLWAMRFAEVGAVGELFVPPVAPWRVTIRAAVEGGPSGGAVVLRRPARAGVTTHPCPVEDRPGLLALPAGDPPAAGWPGVLCLGGSEGGHESQIPTALLLASHGYAALAASWVEPDSAGDVRIARVPLERFAAAARALAADARVDGSQLAATAISRGAEGLLAATAGGVAPPWRGLVLVSPSSVAWQAVGADGEVPDTGSWTLAGHEVPWRTLPCGALMPQLVRNAWRLGADERAHRPSLLRLRPAYRAGLAAGGPGALAAEDVAAPLLLVAGEEDAVWPAAEMAAAIADRRRRSDDELLVRPGAGHLLRPGILPTDAAWTGGIALGGRRAAQAAADRDLTAAMLAFLDRACAVAGSTPPSAVRAGH